ncbi:MAG: YbfB/YjiJ family MFS transporter [Betaproteobacteria bacterium]|nr:MAG: YbfB/YjiJ family MFS transporter [Betaproteobacteria bacterium]
MRIALAGLACLAVAMGIGRFAFTPLLPMMQADSGLSLAAGGWLASANYLGYLFGALSAGFFPRSGKVIRVGLLVIAGATLAMGITYQLAVWAALRLAAGMASALVLVHVSAWCLPRLMGRRTLVGAVYAGVGVGIVVAGALCAMSMAWGASSSQTWIVLGGICLLPTLLLWRVFVPDGSARSPAAGRWNAHWWPLVLCYGAFGFGYIIPATFLPAMARAEVADPALFGWAWPAFGAAAAASTVLTALYSRHIGHRLLWALAQLVMALGVVAPLAVHGLAGILVAALCVGGSFMVVTMTGMQEALRVAGPHAAQLMAAMTAAFATGQILGPVFASLLIEARGSLSDALLAGCLLLATSAFALLPERRNA